MEPTLVTFQHKNSSQFIYDFFRDWNRWIRPQNVLQHKMWLSILLHTFQDSTECSGLSSCVPPKVAAPGKVVRCADFTLIKVPELRKYSSGSFFVLPCENSENGSRLCDKFTQILRRDLATTVLPFSDPFLISHPCLWNCCMFRNFQCATNRSIFFYSKHTGRRRVFFYMDPTSSRNSLCWPKSCSAFLPAGWIGRSKSCSPKGYSGCFDQDLLMQRSDLIVSCYLY